VPLIPLVAVLVFVLALILAMPLLLILRYRAGAARRLGRRWVATVNLVLIVFSAGFFLYVAAITSFWVPDAFRYSLFGLMGGCLLGLLGLALTRWEETPKALHYTPNRWLILIITLAVTARLLYGVWRIWHTWRASGSDTSWLEEAGVAGSLAVGAIVLGYYVTYSAGVRRRLRRRDKT
jgi:amino acid transporter